ncbi:MAG: hypothetical protein ACK5V1_10850, partial [Planctomycetaceae bacterium]
MQPLATPATSPWLPPLVRVSPAKSPAPSLEPLPLMPPLRQLMTIASGLRSGLSAHGVFAP